MVGSLLYWTLAIGLGAQSLMIAGALSYVPQPSDTAGTGGVMLEPSPPTADMVDGMGGTILIQLQESAEPEDVNDNPGAGDTAASDDVPVASSSEPAAL
jgi:hypothetical protein